MDIKQEIEIGISNLIDRFTNPAFTKKIIWTFLSFGSLGVSTTIFNLNTIELIAQNDESSLKVVFSDDNSLYSFIISIISLICAIYFSMKLFKYEMLQTLTKKEYDKERIAELDSIATPDYFRDFLNHIRSNLTILDQNSDLDILEDLLDKLDAYNSALKNKRLEYLRNEFKESLRELEDFVSTNFFDYGMGNSLMLRPNNRRTGLYDNFKNELYSKLNPVILKYEKFRDKCNKTYLI